LFDVRPPEDSNEVVDLRMYLRIDGRPLTETWIYQWVPAPVKDRRTALG
jgi:glucans biosynthesis protein